MYDVECVSEQRSQDLKSHKKSRTIIICIKIHKITKTVVVDVELERKKEEQQKLPKMMWCTVEEVNEWRFKNRGSIFEAGRRGCTTDVKTPVVTVRQRLGKMRDTYGQTMRQEAASQPSTTTLQLYKSSVCSVLTYGSER